MAKKVADVVGELKTLLEQGKLVFGAEKAVKGLKRGTVRKVFLSKNCNPAVRDDVVQYSSFGDVAVVELEQTSIELGAVCRKPFAVSIVSVAKE